MITLGKEQVDALEGVKSFLQSELPALLISGSAGTGKSLLTQYIIKYLEEETGISYCLCAPTHKAALVMQQFTKRDAITLHSLLAMSPKLDILHLNFRQLEFNSGNCKDIPYKGVVICDEASMINDDLFDFLCEKCKEQQCKIIFSGDFAQLQPVKQETKSKVAKINPHYKLRTIYRQKENNPILDILNTLRNEAITKFETTESEFGNLYIMNNATSFVKSILEEYKESIKSKDILKTKILAYTNKRVDNYNKNIHKYLFGEEQYYQFEFLTSYSNKTINKVEYWNSMDYIIYNNPHKIEIDIPHFGVVPGYALVLFDSLTKQVGYVDIIDKNYEGFYELAAFIEEIRLEAIEETNQFRKKQLWSKYYKVINSFASPVDLCFDNRLIYKKDFDYGYATTVHRSQGSTLDNVFIDMKDIFKQHDKEQLRQLQYVAMSRTRNNIYVFN